MRLKGLCTMKIFRRKNYLFNIIVKTPHSQLKDIRQINNCHVEVIRKPDIREILFLNTRKTNEYIIKVKCI